MVADQGSTYPVEVQHGRVLGWPPRTRSISALIELIRALAERYQAVCLPAPVLSYPGHATTGFTDWEPVANLLLATGRDSDLSPFLQSIHTAILGLTGEYVTQALVPITTTDFQGWGVKSSGVVWGTPDLTAASTAITELQFLIQILELPHLSYPECFSFDYAEWTVDAVNTPIAQWAIPSLTVTGKAVGAWKLLAPSVSADGFFTWGNTVVEVSDSTSTECLSLTNPAQARIERCT